MDREDWFLFFKYFSEPIKIHIGDKSTMNASRRGTIKFEAVVEYNAELCSMFSMPEETYFLSHLLLRRKCTRHFLVFRVNFCWICRQGIWYSGNPILAHVKKVNLASE